MSSAAVDPATGQAPDPDPDPALDPASDRDRPDSALAVAAQMFLRELLRRWPTVLFMVLMPASYFAISYLTSDGTTVLPFEVPSVGGTVTVDALDRDVKAIYLAVLGIAVTSSFAALTTVQGSFEVARRLRMLGLGPARLLLARSVVLGAVMVVSCAFFVALFLPTVEVASWSLTIVALLLVALVGVGIGTLVGLLLPREFEAAMVLVALAGIQMALGRGDSEAERVLPYWPGVETLKSAVLAPDPTATGPLLLGLAYAVVLFTLAALVWGRRTHVRRVR